MRELPQALAPLAAYRQWLCFRLVKRANGKADKIPVSPFTGRDCNAHDPAAWADFQTASDAAQSAADRGVAFTLSDADPFFFVDIDNCAEAGQWSQTAQTIMQWFPGAAVEVSQSGNGLHIIASGSPPPHGCRRDDLGLEFYSSKRFIAITGTGATGSADRDFSPVLPSFVAQVFPPGQADGDPEWWSTEPVDEWDGPADDEDLLSLALGSSSKISAFTGKASFSDLWNGDEEALARSYPAQQDHQIYNASAADAALAQHLAFWTGKNCDRIDRLMRRSALVRDKWEREDYLPRTIRKAALSQQDVYARRRHDETNTADPSENVELKSGFQFMPVDQQINHFAGCVYVRDQHRAFVPDGSLLKPEQFRAHFGGYVFSIDATNEKTSKNAWEVFTESQAVKFPKAHSSCFRPQLKPGELVHEDGRVLVNTYVPVPTKRIDGDPGPFLKHVEKLFPNERDREIILAYMAACIQHKGVKFQWAPLIQGEEGNGKTLFSRCVAFALGRPYCHFPKAQDIDNEFNSWLHRKLFIGVEDIYVPESRREVMEALKPMITGDQQEVTYKGVDQAMADVCANFILNSNYKDAIKMHVGSRRFAIFYTPQQHVQDLETHGMAGDYFPALYDWLKGEGRHRDKPDGYGYAIVSNYLEQYAIPDEFNPATYCHRAPKTTSTDEALKMSLGGVEQEILEAVEEGRPGFRGGFISSMALERLLDSIRAARQIPPNRRRDVLKTLGYDWHPALDNGRCTQTVQPDGGKPRLFVQDGHPARNFTRPVEVARAYEKAQEVDPSQSDNAAVRAFAGS